MKPSTRLSEDDIEEIARMIRSEYKELYSKHAIDDLKRYEASVRSHLQCDTIFYKKGEYVVIVGEIQDPFLKHHENFVYHIYITPEHRGTRTFKRLLDGLVDRYGIITGDTLVQSNNFRIFSSRDTPIKSVRFLIGA